MAESEMEVKAAKSVPYRRSMLRAAQLLSEVYSSCGEEGLRCDVLYRRRLLDFQYLHRVKPLEILTSLCFLPYLLGAVHMYCTYMYRKHLLPSPSLLDLFPFCPPPPSRFLSSSCWVPDEVAFFPVCFSWTCVFFLAAPLNLRHGHNFTT